MNELKIYKNFVLINIWLGYIFLLEEVRVIFNWNVSSLYCVGYIIRLILFE